MLTQFRLPSTSLQTILLCLRACSTSATGMGNRGSSVNKAEVPVYTSTPKPKVTFTEDELRQRLSAEEYHITQQKGTERAGSGPHLKVTEEGEFTCVVCGNQLFETDAKFESGTGWPSFSDVASRSDSVVRVVDNSHGMVRTEVLCGQCGAHLGHVFNDGPRDTTGSRYCINGSCLRFSKEQSSKQTSNDKEVSVGEEDNGVEKTEN